MRLNAFASVMLIAAAANLATPAASAGGLAFLYDACASEEAWFEGERKAALARLDREARQAASATAPAEHLSVWLAAERERNRPFFEREIAPATDARETSPDEAYEVWFGEMIAEIDESRRAELMNEHYRALRMTEIAEARAGVEQTLAAEREARLQECQADLRNRTVRFVSRTATAPLRWLGLGSED